VTSLIHAPPLVHLLIHSLLGNAHLIGFRYNHYDLPK
jgi:hypothetical protein